MSDSLPLISIITPTLNSESCIEDCILSVINQKYRNIELIIIDGISSDKTLDIAKRYQSEDVRIRIISEPDKGIYDAMNKGIGLAKGEWLYFLGSDDILFDDKVLSDIFTNPRTRRSEVIYGNVLVDGDAGWARDGEIYNGEFNLDKLIGKNICHQAMFFKSIVFRNRLFNTRFSICADWEMNLRLWSRYSFEYYDRLIAKFRGGNKSLVGINNFTYTDKWESILRSFRFKILSDCFSRYTQEFNYLRTYYKRNRKYFIYLIFNIVYRFHQIRKSKGETLL
jgi:glycosyltransferase involved in cell wall biosynthesis